MMVISMLNFKFSAQYNGTNYVKKTICKRLRKCILMKLRMMLCHVYIRKNISLKRELKASK